MLLSDPHQAGISNKLPALTAFTLSHIHFPQNFSLI